MSTEDSARGITRRQVLKAGAGGALAISSLSAITFLSACGSDASTNSAATGPIQRGGTLSVGMITGGRTETLAVGTGVTLADTCRNFQLYEGLYALDRNNRPVPALAESGESNSKADVWTFKLRDDVVFHNGKPLTADDVIYTINTWSQPASYLNPVVGPYIDFKNVRKRGSKTVEVPLTRPIAEFPSLLCFFTAGIIPDGFTDFAKPVGTGPFKFKSFTPGSQSVFSANKNYWVEGKPYIDELIVNSSFADDEARINALLGNQVDVNPQLPFNQARQYADGSSFKVTQANGPQFSAFFMRVDQGPGKDAKVRQAMKLLVDRPALIESVLSGFGEPGNDLAGFSLPYFAEDLTVERDVEQAKSLLKSAGQEDLRLSLKTSAVTAGFVEAATLLKQQAVDAGVTIDIERIDPSIYFSPAGGYLKNDFSQDYWTLIPSLTSFYLQGLVKDGPYNVTHYGDPKSDKLLGEAMAAVDEATATDRWRAVQELQFDQGGYIIWNTTPFIDGAANRVQNAEATPSGFVNNYDFKSAWLSS